MTKISKKDQDPNQVHKDKSALEVLLSTKSQHFAMNTRVVSNNIGGTVIGISKDGGTKLMIEWDNGTKSAIVNPRMNWRNW